MVFPPLPEGKYRVILADPPWAYSNWSDKAHGAAVAHYGCLDLVELAQLPVCGLAADDAVLLLWTTWPKAAEGDHTTLMQAWGFQPKTAAFLWHKVYPSGRPYCGLGFHTRSGSEVCFLGVRGRPERCARDVYQVITAPVTRHSAKPEDQYRRIERLWRGPRIELFARQRREGWDAWGLEAPAVAEDVA